ncbi:MAG: division/cell wall cluster transcriptional repressor MraZ [Ilumatobacter sp.]
MYVGTHERQLDERGRVALPSSYRNVIGDQCFLTVGNEGCVSVMDADRFSAVADAIVARVEAGTATRAFQRAFAGSVDVAPIDKQGRITVDAELLSHAGVAPRSPVIVVGALDRIEIWEPERWHEQEARGRAQLNEESA